MKILKKISFVAVLLSAVFYLGSCGSSRSTTTATPTGSGSVTLDPATKVLTGSFVTMNITATAAHIHDGDVGVTGAVVVPLTQSTPGTWSVPTVPPTVLTDAQILRLQGGHNYVNVHTTLNPAGEIRGQLMPESANANKFNATLDRAQEVPAPTIPSGAAY